MRAENISPRTSDNDGQSKTGLLLRTFVFVSIHVAFVGAGVLLYSG